MAESVNVSASVNASSEPISPDLFIDALHFSVHHFSVHIFCLGLLIGQSETESRGQLEGARAARAKDRADPVIGLPKSKLILVRGTAGCALRIGLTRRSRTDVSVQRAAITGQVRNVEDVEAFSDQIEPDL